MTGKQLKNSILQWAIQGKLVPQDPNDEPASVLLEKIRQEKERLIKEKKIKRDKNASIIYRGEDNSYYEKILATGEVKCIDEEIPFEVPKGWELARFGTVVYNRDSERIPLSVSERSRLKKTYDYYGASGVIDKVDKYLFDKDLLLIGEDGANLINRSTPIAFIATGKYWVNNHAHVLDCIDNVFMRYICLYINSISLVEYVTGTAQPKMNQEKMNSIMVLVPPYKEQIRILEKVEEVLPTIMRYGASQCRLNVLNKELYANLRKSLLQEAIQGKLVPQDPSDEPASILLQRIRDEKQRLVKEGKLKKKDVIDSTIFRGDDNKYYEQIGKETIEITEEIPFDLPDSWAWVRMGQIGDWGAGSTPHRSNVEYYNGDILWLKTGELNNSVVYDTEEKITQKALSECSLRLNRVGDILIAMYGATIGKVAIAGKEMTTNQACCGCTPFLVNNWYLFYYLMASRDVFIKKGEGGAQPNISRVKLVEHLMPLPPLQEQQRIVAQIEKLFEQLK